MFSLLRCFLQKTSFTRDFDLLACRAFSRNDSVGLMDQFSIVVEFALAVSFAVEIVVVFLAEDRPAGRPAGWHR